MDAKSVLLRDASLMNIDAPVVVVGDIHGQYDALLRLLDLGGRGRYLFLGDYVDRGPNSIECISLLFCLKLLWPDRFFLLRGNHETPEMTASYGFSVECNDRYPDADLWNDFLEVFDCLPFAAIVGGSLFCVHGGISEYLDDVNVVRQFSRPSKVPEQGTIYDLLWANPRGDQTGFGRALRNAGTYGTDVTASFLAKNNLKVIVRAHESCLRGFEMNFGEKGPVITVFSAPDYGGMGNLAAIMLVGEDLTLTFKQFGGYISFANRASKRTVQNGDDGLST
jgi:serine/threonine-protein phosphatase PP1 catalytic subunit